jgi:hypothetical protein
MLLALRIATQNYSSLVTQKAGGAENAAFCQFIGYSINKFQCQAFETPDRQLQNIY